MKIWDKIKQIFKRNQPKRLEAGKPKKEYQEKANKEEIQVKEEKLEEAKIQKQEVNQRDFQIMLVIKNLCRTGINLEGFEFANMLQATLQRFGYVDYLQLDQLDLEILSKANMGLNIRESKKLSEYLNNSKDQAGASKILMEQVRKKAIEIASKWQCNEKEAYR